MDIEEFRKDYLRQIRSNAEYNRTDPEEQFINMALEQLVDMGEIIDPFPISCEMYGRRGRLMEFDSYAYDDADSSIVLIISDFQNTEEKTTLTNSRIDELCKHMLNFVDEAYSGNIREFCDDSDPIIDIAKEFKAKIGHDKYDTEVMKIKLYIITNSTMSTKVKSLNREPFLNRPVEVNVWTLERFFEFYQRDNSESIVVHTSDFGCPEGIQCLKASITGTDYDAYMAIVPGRFLADLYLKYGSKLLQGNIRAFLSIKGKVNKKIRETIMKEPNRFFTYNNGIAVVARSIELSDDGSHVLSFSDFQIINGGQTTASLANAIIRGEAIHELEGIYVPMKLTVLNVADEMTDEDVDMYNDITQKISRCANSQNSVTDADFFSNHPYHVKMEELSRKTPAPAVNGSPFSTIWFYERSRGKYEQEQMKLTEAQRRQFKEKNPKNQLIKKEKIAKCLNAVHMLPHSIITSSSNSMKVFAAHIEQMYEKSKDCVNELYFKRCVAAVILFDTTDQIVNNASWYPKGGHKAEIVPYSVAKLMSMLPDGYTLDWNYIWQKQRLPNAVIQQMELVAFNTQNFLLNTTASVREYAKRAETWRKYNEDKSFGLSEAFIQSLIPIEAEKHEIAEAKREHKFNRDIDATVAVYNLGAEYWMKVYMDLKDSRIISSGNSDFILSMAQIIRRGSLPSNAQIKKLLNVIKQAEDAGYIMP